VSNEVTKHLPAVMLGAGVASMILILTFALYRESQPTSPTASLNMYDKYREYSSHYADQLYNRVGDVTDTVDSYQRTTDYRITQLELQLEALRKQMASQVTINNTNTNTNRERIEDERLDVQ